MMKFLRKLKFTMPKLVILLSFALLQSACVKEETDCILFCEGDSTVSFVTSSKTVQESVGTVRVYVKVSPTPISSLQVSYSLNTGLTTATAADYTFTPSTLTFNSGESSKYFEFVINSDAEGSEGTEYVSFKLGYPTDGELGSYTTITYAINDDDVTDMAVNEGATGVTPPITCDDGSGGLQSYVISTESDPDSNCSLTSAPVKVSCAVNYKAGHSNWTSSIVVDCTQNGLTSPIAFDVDVTSINQAPILTTVGSLSGTGAQSGAPLTISYATLIAAAADEAELDADTMYIRIENIDDGTVTKSAVAVQSGITFIGTGESFVWTPSLAAQGDTAAFDIAIFDGSLASTPVQLNVQDIFNFVKPTAFSVTEGALGTDINQLVCADGNGSAATYVFNGAHGGYDATANCSLSSATDPSFVTCTPGSKSGQTNWSTEIEINCDLGGGVNKDQTMVINVSNTNQIPTLTGVTDFTSGAAGVDYAITYAQLNAKATAADADGDVLSFRIVNIVSGSLTMDGVPIVPGTTNISIGKTVVWTPGTSDLGIISAFNILAYDGIAVSGSATPINIEMAGVSSLPDPTVSEGAVYASTILNCDDGTGIGAPVYSINVESDGDSNCSINGAHPTATLDCSPSYKTGQANWTSNITLRCAVNASTYDHIFTVNVSNQNQIPTLATMSTLAGAVINTPYTVTYAMLTTAGDEADLDSPTDPMMFRIEGTSNGVVTKNSVVVVADGSGAITIGAGEEIVWTPDSTAVGLKTLMSVVAYDGVDPSTSVIPVKADLDGLTDITNFTVAENAVGNSINAYCADNTLGATTFSILSQSDTDANCVWNADKVTCSPAYKTTQTDWTSLITVRCAIGATNYDKAFTLTASNDNRPPTLTVVTNVSRAAINTDFVITYAAMAAAGNEADLDTGDTINFQIKTVLTGVLNKAGTPILGDEIIQAGEDVTWTPPVNTTGAVAAFTIVAHDGTDPSASLITVYVETGGIEAITDIATIEGSTVTTATIICADGAGGSPTLSLLAETDTDTNCSVLSAVPPISVQCLPNAKIGQSNWDGDVTVQCVVGAETYTNQFNVAVTNANQAPVLTALPNIANHAMDAPLIINYSYFETSGSITDADDASNTLEYRVVSVTNGTATINGGALTPGISQLAVGGFITWTPTPGTVGTTPAISVKAVDPSAAESIALEVVNVEIKGFKQILDIAAVEGINSVTELLVCNDGIGGVPAYSVITQTNADSACSIAAGGVSCTPNFITDQNNWTSDITIQCNVGVEIFTDTFTASVTNSNQVPTLTAIASFPGLQSGVSYAFTWAAIDAASDAADLDLDNIQYRVEGLNSGTLTINGGGAVTPGTTTISAGDTLEWTSAVAADGNLTAFTVKAFDGFDYSTSAIGIDIDDLLKYNDLLDLNVNENATVLSATLACSDASNVASYAIFNETDSDSTCTIIGAPGSEQVSCSPIFKLDQTNWTSVITVRCTQAAYTADRAFTVNVTNVNQVPTLTTISNFTAAEEGVDYTISYADFNAATDRTDPDTADPAWYRIEQINSGALKLNGTAVVAGVDELKPGDILTWTSAAAANGVTSAFDVVAWDGLDPSAPQVNVNIEVTDFATIANFSVAENAVASTPNLICTSGTGAPVYSVPTQPADTNCVITGADPYQVQCSPDYRDDQAIWTETITVRCDDGGIIKDKTFDLTVTNVNRVPTLTTVALLVAARTDVPYTITFAALETAADEADLDTDTLFFRVEGVTTGTLTKNSSPILPGITTFATGETLVWTGAAGTMGDTVGFTIVAHDGTTTSAAPVNVSLGALFDYDPIADLTAGAENLFIQTPALACDDGTGTVNSNFTLTLSDADLGCVLSTPSGTPTIDCTPVVKPGHAAWSGTVTADCASNGFTYQEVFTVSVADVNQIPTLTTVANLGSTPVDTDYSFTHADLLAASDAADVDDPAGIRFRVNTVAPGSFLKKNGIDITAGTEIFLTGETLVWTPPGAATGDQAAFTVEAYDGIGYSGVDTSVNIYVIDFVAIVPNATAEGASTNISNFTCTDGSGASPTFSIVSETDADSMCVSALTPDRFECHPNYKSGQAAWTSDVVVRCTINGVDSDQTVTVSIANTNRVPTLTTISEFTPGVFIDGALMFEMTYAEILAASDLNDADGDAVVFRIDTQDTGSIEIDPITDGSWAPAVDTVTTLEAGGTIRWVPAGTESGTTTALTVTAVDAGGAPSAAPVNIDIDAFEFQSILGLTVAEGATNATAAAVCNDGTIGAPIITITNESDAESNCVVNTGTIECTPNFKPGASGWTSSITVACSIGAIVNSRVLLVSVTDLNQLPAVTTFTKQVGAYSLTDYDITFATFDGANDATDADGDPVTYILQSTVNGNLQIDPISDGTWVPVTAGVTEFLTTATIRWTAPSLASGDISAFQYTAYDQIDESTNTMTAVIETNLSPAILSTADTTHSFGNIAIGVTSATFIVNLTYAGEQPATVNNVYISEGFRIDSHTCVAPGNNLTFSCTYTIVFDSLSSKQGLVTGTFAINYFDGDSNQYVELTTLSATGTAAGTGGFDPVATIPVGNTPTSVVSGDFDGDASMDLVVCNKSSNTVSIIRLAGASVTSVGVGTNPQDAAIGDLNNDGFQDIAIVNYGSKNITILSGDGTGAFISLGNITISDEPYAIDIADFDGDGNKDLVVAEYMNDRVVYSTGNGDFTFDIASTLTVGDGPNDVMVTDFNNDGAPDILVTNFLSASASVIENDQSGVLSLNLPLSVGSNPSGLTIGDINADGFMDVLITNSGPATISIFTGDGTFSMSAQADFSVSASPQSVFLGNINGAIDTNLDLISTSKVVTNGDIDDAQGDGIGGFIALNSTQVDSNPTQSVLTDFNGDGFLDFISVDSSSNQVSWAAGN